MPPLTALHKAGLLALLTLACYLPALRGPWVFDDHESIARNPLITQAGNFGQIWSSTQQTDYWPVSYTAFWLQWRVFGNSTLGYHVVSVLLHVGAALLAWQVLLRLQIPGAWLIALLFAVHPVNVETAAWIFQQKTTLAALGFLAALWAWLVYDEQGDRRYYAAALALFTLAMLAKTSAVALPVILLCCAWWRRDRIGRGDLVKSAPFFAVALLLGLISVWFQTHRAIGETIVREDGFLGRLAGAGWALWFYLGKALWPTNLAFVYPRWEIDGASPVAHLPWLAWLALAVVGWRLRPTAGKPILLALAWFTLALAPVLGFVNVGYMRYSLVADHWQYLALLAPLALLIGGLHCLIQSHAVAFTRYLPPLAAATVALCCLLSWRQARCYRTEEALWTDSLAKNPHSWMVHNNLGLTLLRQKKLPEAEAKLREALRLLPGDPTIQTNLAGVLNLRQQYDEAIKLALAALAQRPDHAVSCLTLGAAYAGRFEDEEARRWLEKSVQIRPQEAAARLALGKVLLRQGDARAAAAQFRQSLELNDNEADAHVSLAQALASQSQWSAAKEQLDAALKLDWQNAEAHLQLANLAASEGRLADAAQLLAHAVERQPQSAQLHGALAERLAAQGRLPEAWQHAQLALKLDPQVPELCAAAGDVLASLGRIDEAMAQYRAALKINPRLADAHKSLGGLLAAAGLADEAIEQYRIALSLKPAWPAVSSHLAWLLATRPDASQSEKQEALQWAQRACRETNNQHPVALDSLAAAYAANGQFTSALDAARQARDRATALGQHEFAREVQDRMDGYSSRRAGVPHLR